MWARFEQALVKALKSATQNGDAGAACELTYPILSDRFSTRGHGEDRALIHNAVDGGCNMVILNGEANHPVGRLKSGERCTLFRAKNDPLAVRKQWIRGLMAPKGEVELDAGAVTALGRGASLLPAGVTQIDGIFERGDLVALKDQDGHIVGQGLSAYGALEAAKIMGRKMNEVAGLLGYEGRSALVHRDDLVVF